MRFGKHPREFVFNEPRSSGYKLLLSIPGVISVAHQRGTILPHSEGAQMVTVVLFGGIGGGMVWRFEDYRVRR